MTLKITTLDDLKEISSGNIIELPGWEDDKTLVAKVKRVSLLSLASDGLIPNQLLGAADKVFNGKQDSKIDMKEMGMLFDVIVKATLVKPSLEDITEAGLVLTDSQKISIFNYTQEGLKGLEKFRPEQTSVKNNKPSTKIQKATK